MGTVVHITADFENRRKGGRYVLELARRMPDVSFYIIGNHKPINNTTPNVYPRGRTESGRRLAEWYSLGDVTLITSEKETFSMICAESLACGTPVAGFDAGAPPEVAPEGYGVFVPHGDVPALENAIRNILQNGLNSRDDCAAFAKLRYAKETMAKRYIDLYR